MFKSLEGFQYEKEEKKSKTTAARNLGEKIARTNSIKTPPIDVFDLVQNKYGIKVREISLDNDISAIVDLNNQDITLNRDKHIYHKRFTLAHELGHILLKHNQRKWTDFSNYITDSNPDKPLEEEANAFAAGLLMPKYLLLQYIKKGYKIKKLAYLFQVSEQALWYSLSTYKLINKIKY
jgi:Zn-dependent peptidase ImmA (M78 family)